VSALLVFPQFVSDKTSLPRSSPKEPEVKIWVTVGDKVLSVFKEDATDQANITCDITGIEGKEYKVSRTASSKPSLCMRG